MMVMAGDGLNMEGQNEHSRCLEAIIALQDLHYFLE